jgi:hypothetical protein
MSSKGIGIFIAVAIVAALALSGCGGSDAPALSKFQFIQQGDALCRRFENEKQVAIESFVEKEGRGPFKALSSRKRIEEVSTAILPSIKSISEELRDLGVPDSDQGKGDKLVTNLEAAVAELEANPKLLRGEADPFGQVAKEAKAYGFKTCILYY